MKARVLLINPTMTQEEIYAHYGKSAPMLAPLGLCYLASVLLQDGFHVEILDGVIEKSGKDDAIERIKGGSATIVGLTATTVCFYSAVRIAERIKEYNPDILTLIGGPHVSAIPEETLSNHGCFDIGVIGEGELTLLEIAKEFDKAKELKDFWGRLDSIKGIAFRSDGLVVVNKRRELIKNMDEIPPPARHLLPDINKYNTNIAMGEDRPLVHVIPSRGCPFACIYCDHNVFGRTWRSFSTKYVLDEIEDLIRRYHVRTIVFHDDLFTANHEKVEDFCAQVKKRGMRFKWNVTSRVNLIDEQLAKKMYDAGCRTIYFGIESGDQRMLDFIKKGITLEQAKKAVEVVKKVGLMAHGSFIIGLPTDTKETIEKTIQFALSLPLDVATFHIAVPYPNTEFERIAEGYGTIKSRDWSKYSGHPNEVIFIANGLSGEYLLKKQKEAYRRFFFRGRVIKSRIRDLRISNIPGYFQGLKALVFNQG